MMHFLFVAMLLAFLSPPAMAQDAVADKRAGNPHHVYHVYFMGGQSNMEGFGYNAELPEDIRNSMPDIPIFHGKIAEDGEEGGGVGLWQMMRPGHGTGFDTNGKTNLYSDRFGPEYGFAAMLKTIQPDKKFAIVKYARGGTALVHGVSGYGSWDPDYHEKNGRNQYDNALTTIHNAFAARDIDGDGYADTLIPAGIIWMQGEADAFDNIDAALGYKENLQEMIQLLRAALHDNDLPVVIGRIADSGKTAETQVMAYSAVVQAAQQAFVAQDQCAAMTDVTKDFEFLPDGWHYRSQNYVELGGAFALRALDLAQNCKP